MKINNKKTNIRAKQCNVFICLKKSQGQSKAASLRRKRQWTGQKKKKNYKRKTMIYKKLNRKQKVEQHKSHKNRE